MQKGWKAISLQDKTIPFYVVKSFIGKDLVGISYEQLLDYALPNDNPENAFRIISR